jgi:hypothetical protein
MKKMKILEKRGPPVRGKFSFPEATEELMTT